MEDLPQVFELKISRSFFQAAFLDRYNCYVCRVCRLFRCSTTVSTLRQVATTSQQPFPCLFLCSLTFNHNLKKQWKFCIKINSYQNKIKKLNRSGNSVVFVWCANCQSILLSAQTIRMQNRNNKFLVFFPLILIRFLSL